MQRFSPLSIRATHQEGKGKILGKQDSGESVATLRRCDVATVDVDRQITNNSHSRVSNEFVKTNNGSHKLPIIDSKGSLPRPAE